MAIIIDGIKYKSVVEFNEFLVGQEKFEHLNKLYKLFHISVSIILQNREKSNSIGSTVIAVNPPQQRNTHTFRCAYFF